MESMKRYEAYEQALQGEERLTMTYLKFIFFGLPRSGKSSTRRRLVHEIVNLRSLGGVSKSTGVAESSDVIIKKLTSSPAAIVTSEEKKGSSEWQSLNSPEEPNIRDHSKQKGWKADHKYLAQVFFHLITTINPNDPEQCDAVEESNPQVSSSPVNLEKQEVPPLSVSISNSKEKEVTPSSPRATLKATEKATMKIDEKSAKIAIEKANEKATEKDVGKKEIEKAIKELTTILQSDSPEDLQLLLENLILINMIDAGGQPAFVEMLPALTIGSALYFLFFRMDQDLRKLHPVRFLASEKSEDTVLESSYCIEDVLCQSLSSVACFTSSVASTSLLSQRSISRALLFGTYKDEVEKQGNLEARISEVNETLWKKLSKIQKNLLLRADNKHNFFLVDNMDGNDEIDHVRKEIESIVKNVFPKVQIPPSWLMFRILLHLMNKPVVSMALCEGIARRLRMPTPVEEAVWFFHHNIGSLLYYPEIQSMEDLVICNPQVVFDCISELIIDTFKVSNRAIPESAIEEFHDKGIFTLGHIEHSTENQTHSFLAPKQLIDLLKYLNILAEITLEQESSPQTSTKYIIPAVLKCASEDELQHRGIPTPTDRACSLMIHFNCGFVPFGVFCAGIAHLIDHHHTLSPTWQLNKNCKLKKNKATFLIDGTFFAVLISRPQNLEVQVYRSSGARRKKSLPEICSSIRQTVVETLETVIFKLKYKATVLTSEERPFHLAFICSMEGHDDHFMRVVEDEKDRYCKCLMDEGELDLGEKHLIWFNACEVRACTV